MFHLARYPVLGDIREVIRLARVLEGILAIFVLDRMVEMHVVHVLIHVDDVVWLRNEGGYQILLYHNFFTPFLKSMILSAALIPIWGQGHIRTEHVRTRPQKILGENTQRVPFAGQ